MIRDLLRRRGYLLVEESDPWLSFHANNYLRHNARRLEHLASLGIPVAGRTVLEVGAGLGDHTHYYLDRGCGVTITDARASHLDYLAKRYPNCDNRQLDMEDPTLPLSVRFDIIHCYGLLYHLKNPGKAIHFLAQYCHEMLFLETCVSFGEEEAINPVDEEKDNPVLSVSGTGCRPTRPWLYNRLREHFEYVYIPNSTQSRRLSCGLGLSGRSFGTQPRHLHRVTNPPPEPSNDTTASQPPDETCVARPVSPESGNS